MYSTGLREARNARGWSQRRLVAGIEEYARRRGLEIASTPSLVVYVSEWENGRRVLSDSYAAILRAVLGVTDGELFGDVPGPVSLSSDGYAQLLESIDSARSVGRGMVGTLLAQTELLRTMDRQAGAASLVDQMGSHLAALQEVLTFAVLPDARRPVAIALAGAATLAAWQALDVGAADRAWRHYELAKTAARDADEIAYLAHAMAEQAYVLVEAGRNDLAVSLAQEARRTGGSRISSRLSAWLNAVEGELCALAGLPEDCRHALDRAVADLPPDSEDRDPEMVSIFLNQSHFDRWRGNTLALIGDANAVGELYGVLETMDPTFVRARAGVFSHLAQAHLVREEAEDARSCLLTARRLAGQTGSVRHRRRVERLMRTV
ncbi:helix-turn-helix domain-containing protein [Actinoplanes hulinensis]|uniref:Helix-turn-helix domain-containing protein n=1 Tax=Actinoplanes hulinensis TaxID=1144547 RepID=A0ABS7AWF8_9ACTN|nr:helix-turn-helix transcriptional regulator [Actinoplanes hulinensis]MBW6433083.1 helix-turn-helix domain-containing protein [Actinoplanes hulinensis]